MAREIRNHQYRGLDCSGLKHLSSLHNIMAATTPHASLKELTEFSLGRLVADKATSVERHLRECERCCETLLGLPPSEDTFVQLLRETRDHTVLDTGSSHGEDPPQELLNHPRYEILELVGAGGMGVVYRARHRVMDRTVAIKVINRRMVGHPQAIKRFHREMKSAARLVHPNIVTAFDAEQEGDVHFLAMEYVDGRHLASVVESRGRLKVSEACDYICQAAAGLQHAHTAGMIHRDIKPYNLMLTTHGTVKILDFGLAALSERFGPDTGTVETRSDLTTHGTIMGTPDYISPEQAADARQVDSRSDIYSLGATLYFLLAGHPPFAADSVTEVLAGHADSDPPQIQNSRSDIPLSLQNIIARMMSKNPADRFQSSQDVIAALQPFVD